MLELCICFYEYPKNDARYYLYNTWDALNKDITKWLNDKIITFENIKYIKYVKEN